MNANTILGFGAGTTRNKIPALTVATTTETAFSVTTDTGTTVAVLSLPLQTGVVGSSNPQGVNGNPAILGGAFGAQQGPAYAQNRPYFNSDSFNGLPFRVRLSGKFTSGVATNDLKISLYLGNSATLGSDSVISAALTTGTSGNFGAVSGHFSVSYLLTWDSTTGKVDGVLEDGFISPSGVATTAIATTAATQAAAAAASNLQFVATAKWNAANAANTVQVTDFSLEMV